MRIFVFGLVGWVACGGQVAPGDAGAPTDAGGGAKDAGGDAATNCDALATQIAQLEEQARTCCPICNTPQCSFSVEGLCCPVSITATSAPAYTQAVAKFKQACGPIACPATPCRVAPSKVCVPNGSGTSQSGRCE